MNKEAYKGTVVVVFHSACLTSIRVMILVYLSAIKVNEIFKTFFFLSEICMGCLWMKTKLTVQLSENKSSI